MVLQAVIFAALVMLAIVPFLYQKYAIGSFALCSIAILSVCLAISGFARPVPDKVIHQLTPSKAKGSGGYTTSNKCMACHPGEYSTWHDSYHRSMTRLATPQTVVAPFDGRSLKAEDVVFKVEREGDQFWATLPDPDWEMQMFLAGFDFTKIPNPPKTKKRIVMVTGSHHMQSFWVNSEQGDLRLFPWVYRIKQQKWIPYQDSYINDPSQSRVPISWNTNCIACHSVDGRPMITEEGGTPSFSTEVVELGIACEACHGPADDHVAKHQNPFARIISKNDDLPDDTIVNPRRLSHETSAQVCGQCHASFVRPPFPNRYWKAGSDFIPGNELADQEDLLLAHFDVVTKSVNHPLASHYWSDGTSRIGGREYMGMKESGCYQQGTMSCLSCHEMHGEVPDDQLKSSLSGNASCLQCHSEYANKIEEHTHHSLSSSGSQCLNCHMPHTTYALFKGIRNHRIQSPHTTRNLKSDRPNACNLCHADQTLEWTANKLVEWYEQPSIDLNKDEKTIAASLVWIYQGDAAQRAITAWNMGQQNSRAACASSGPDWQVPHLVELMNDRYSVVREIAADAVAAFGYQEIESFDYISSEKERVKKRQAILESWKSRLSGREDFVPTVLLNPDGSLHKDVIGSLLGYRDHQILNLAE